MPQECARCRFQKIMQPETKYAKSGDYSIAYQAIGDGPIEFWYSHRASYRTSKAHGIMRCRRISSRGWQPSLALSVLTSVAPGFPIPFRSRICRRSKNAWTTFVR